METLANILPGVIAQANPNEPKLPSSNPQTTSVTALIQDPQGKRLLSNLIFQCFDALKVYGKEPEQMENVNAMFQLVLCDYSISDIRKAFAFYLRHNTELPAPADIANIIERGMKPPFDRSIYVTLSKKFAEQRSSEEWAYMREYERFMISGRY